MPQITAELWESEADRTPENLLFSEFLQMIQTRQEDKEEFYLIDMTATKNCDGGNEISNAKKISSQSLHKFLSAYFQETKDRGTRLLILINTFSVPRDPLATLTKDMRPFVQIFLPFLQSAHVCIEPGEPCTISCVIGKAFSFHPILEIFYHGGLVPPLSGTRTCAFVEVGVLMSNNELQHKEICRVVLETRDHEEETTIPLGKWNIMTFTLYHFIFRTTRENLNTLTKKAILSWQEHDEIFWVGDIDVLDKVKDENMKFFVLTPDFSPALPQPESTIVSSSSPPSSFPQSSSSRNIIPQIVEISKKSLTVAQETATSVFALVPKKPTSLILALKGTQNSFSEFFTSLQKECPHRLHLLTTRGRREITPDFRNALMVYPIGPSFCLQEMQQIIEKLLQAPKTEVRQKGIRVFCDPATTDTWRTFQGFLQGQRVRIRKEREKEADGFSWWGSLKESEKQQINDRRSIAFATFPAEIRPQALPLAGKRPRKDESSRKDPMHLEQ